MVAVTKTVTGDRIREVVDAGVRDLGENRAQELLAHAGQLDGARALQWHFVGRLQRNKIAAVAPWVSCWHSVDREALAVPLARVASGARVLVQVNLAAEPQKGGCAPAEAPALVDRLRGAGLDVAGLMTVPPAAADPRAYFASLRELAARLGLHELSMGMSSDYEVAVEEGATMVRIGTALFGERSGRDRA